MHKLLTAITIGPKESIRKAMEAIDTAGKKMPPAPIGIVLVMQGKKLLGIATDGDIRNAILQGTSLEDPIGDIMIKKPLTVLHDESPDAILSQFHDTLRERKLPENRFNHILTVDEEGALVDIFTPFELWKRSEVKIKTVSVMDSGT